MRIIETVGIANRGNVLPASHSLAATNKDFVEMSVKRIDVAHASAFAIGVPNNNHVSPALMTIARENNDTVANGINRIAEICVTAAHSVPILAEMAVCPNAARFIISAGIWFTHRKIET